MILSNVLVLVAAVLCTYLAQSKRIQRSTRRGFSFIGGLACVVVAAEALLRDEVSTAILFGIAAAINLFLAASSTRQQAGGER